ncbi:amidohydrolase [Mesorhizobium sp. Cs1299R1N1]|uniref:amidohydrolase n=1 Tax=Mesorhizobium sp. Cs1299R1N1 TaxID=3015172 RepID=UPI00301BFD8B
MKRASTDLSRRTILQLLATLPMAAVGFGGANAAEFSLQDLESQLVQLPEITIYRARRVITMAAGQPAADAVAVVGSRVLAAGKLDELQQLVGKQPFKTDDRFAEKIIIAGMIDQHLHPILAAGTLTWTVIAIEDWVLPAGTSKAASDAASYIARVKEAETAISDPNEPLMTWGYHHYFHGMVRRTQLDAISKTRPIFVWHRSGHEFILNTAALDLVGITPEFVANFPETAKAQTNLEDGYFFEQGMFAALPKLVPVFATKERLFAGLDLIKDYVHRSGLTIIGDPGAMVSKPLQEALNSVFGGDDVPFRTYFLPDGKTMALEHIEGDLIGETEALLGWGKGKAEYLPKQVKLFADGAIFSQLMQMSEGYTDGHHGEWIMEPALFDKAFDAYWKADYHIHIHQNGDAGLDTVLNALERNMSSNPKHDHRTEIVHFGYARPDQVPRIAALGAVIGANPYYVTALADIYGNIGLGKERADHMVPIGDAGRLNISTSLHSDLPMAPGQPLFLVWSAVNRTTFSGRVAGPEQRLSVEQALQAVTIGPARSYRLEDEIGSIEPGKLANFTILESDPFEVAPETIKDIAVWGTVHEGTVYPVKQPDGTMKKASLSFPKGADLPAATGASFASIANRGGSCNCCEPVSSMACTDATAGANSSPMAGGCCRTNVFGLAMAAHWAEQLGRG